jgi:hypothetical protein
VLLAALGVAVLTAAPAAGSSAGLGAAATGPSTSWTLDQAEAAVGAGTIARLPGAPAVIDQAAVEQAIGEAPIRIAMLPFVPVDDNRTTVEQRAVSLQTWGEDQGWGMVVIQGLQVLVSAFDVQPGTVADLNPVLAGNDVTHQVLRAITVLQQQSVPSAGGSVPAATGPTATDRDSGGTGGAPAPLPAQTAADPEQVQQIGDALASSRVYSAPGVDPAQTVADSWANVGAGLTVRAAFLPAVGAGDSLTNLIGPLSKRFPHDVVVVVRGRWIDVAGPDQEVLDSALLWLYGNYMKPFLRWDVQPSQFVGLLAGQIGLLRTGVVSGQAAPTPPRDPVSGARGWLPWLFVATALVLGAGGWWAGRARRRRRVVAEAGHREGLLVRRRFGARLARVAGRIVDLDGLAEDGTARDEVDAAVERYRVARDVLTDDGDLRVAGEALDAAERHLVSAGRIVDGPPAAPSGTPEPPGTPA